MRRRRKKSQVFSYGDTKYQKFRNIDTRPFITGEGNPADRRSSYRNNRNSIWPLFICLAVCFFVIDGSIYAYFKFIKKQPVLDGLQEWRLLIKDLFNSDPTYVLERDPMSKRAMPHFTPDKYTKENVARTPRSKPT